MDCLIFTLLEAQKVQAIEVAVEGKVDSTWVPDDLLAKGAVRGTRVLRGCCCNNLACHSLARTLLSPTRRERKRERNSFLTGTAFLFYFFFQTIAREKYGRKGRTFNSFFSLQLPFCARRE